MEVGTMDTMELVANSNGAYSIENNIDAITEVISDKLEKYRGLIYSKEQVSSLTKDLAGLRKLQKAVKGKRDEIKKIILEAGYLEFELKAKQLEDIIIDVINELAEQKDRFEEKRVSEKVNAINTVFNEIFIEYLGIINIDAIFQETWKNKGVTLKTITAEITSNLEELNTCMQYVNEQKEELRDRLTSIAIKSFSVALVMQEINKISIEEENARKLQEVLNEKKEIEEARKEKEKQELEDKIRLAKEEVSTVQVMPPAPVQVPIEQIPAPVPAPVPADIVSLMNIQELVAGLDLTENDDTIYTCEIVISGSQKALIVKNFLAALEIENNIEEM